MTLSLIESKLAQLRSHIRLMFLSYGLGLVVIWIACLALWLFWTDYLLNLPAVVRIGFLVASFIALAVIVIRNIIYPLTRTLTDEDLALLVEREYPLLNDRLITSLQFLKNQERYKDVASANMMNVVVGESFDLAGKLQFGDAVRSRRLLFVVIASIVAMSTVFAHAYLARDPMSTWARRVFGADIAWPTRTKLDVKFLEADQLALFPTEEDLNINFNHDPATEVFQVALDSDLRIIAEPSGEVPDSAEVRIEVYATERDASGALIKKALQNTIKREMNRDVLGTDPSKGERVVFSYNKLSAQNTWEEIYIKAGDALAGPYVIVVIPPPELAGPLELTYRHAEYLRLPDKSTQERAIEGVAGTRVTMRFATTKALQLEGADASRLGIDFNVGTSRSVNILPDVERNEQSARELERSKASKMALPEQRFHYLAEISLAMGMSRYTLRLVDKGGIANSKRLGDLMQVKEDIAPAVRINFSGDPLVSNQLVAVAKDAVIPIEYELSDDYGVGSAKLFWRYIEESEFREFKPFENYLRVLREKPQTLVKDTWSLEFEALTRDVRAPSGSARPTLEVYMQAFDLRQTEIDEKTGQPQLQGSKHNPIMSYELYTVDDLRAKVSTQIRQVKTTINAMVSAQTELQVQTHEALGKKDLLNLEGEEGRRLRTDLNNAFQKQNQLLRDAEAVMERFGVFAQVYQFSRLERDDQARPQEGRIQSVRMLLAVAGADREQQQLLTTPLNLLKDAEGDVVGEVTAELLRYLLRSLKRAKPDASFVPASFGMLLQDTNVDTPGCSERSRSLCEGILSTSITPSERRELLAELARQQKLNVDMLKAVQAQVKKWEGFDDLLAGFRGLRDSQKDINDNLRDEAKNK